jgi:hypothetical protein
MGQLADSATVSSPPRLRLVSDEIDPPIISILQFRRSTLERPRLRSRPRFSPTAPVRTRDGNPLERARLLHVNRRCPHCLRASVLPIDLGDGDCRSTSMPVPGTSTLVGFLCQCCGAEWSI